MNCFRKLGIKQTATIQEIKRAYAGKLKQHRPDEDPVGFQEINTAYQSAIDSAKHRDAWLASKAEAEQKKQLAIAEGTYVPEEDDGYYDEDEYYFYEDEDEDDQEVIPRPDLLEAASAAPELPAAAPVVPDSTSETVEADIPPEDESPQGVDEYIFRLDDFIVELEKVSSLDDDRALKKWLDGHPDLYSLYLKHQITDPLISALAQSEKPIRPPALEIVITFFGLDAVSTNHYWIDHQVDMARQKSRVHWHAAAIAFQRRNRKRSLHQRWIDESLRGEANKFKSIYLLMVPGLPSQVMEVANESRDEYGNMNAEFVDPAHYEFWREANDKTKIASQRFYMALTRSAILALIAKLILGMPTTSAGILALFAGIFGSWLSLALLRLGNYRLDVFISKSERADKSNILLAILVPTIAITALTVGNEAVRFAIWMVTFLCFTMAVTYGHERQYRPAAIFAVIASAAFWLSVFFGFSEIPFLIADNVLILTACLSIAVVIIHDEIYTRKSQCSFEETHENHGWLFWVGLAFSFLFFCNLWIHWP